MKKGLKIFLSIVLVLAILGGIAALSVTFYGKKYVRAEDTAYTVLQITDVHILNDEKKDAKAYKTISEMVNTTKPDMIAVTGDVTSEKENFTAFKSFCTFMEKFEIPWAFVYGNHDNEIPTNSLNWQGDKYEASKYCLFRKGPSNLYGCGNYVVNIVENGKPVYSVYMFDNGRYLKYDKDTTKEIYMGYEQIAWYEWNVLGINKAAGYTVPSMTFSHFAQPEFKEAIEKCGVKGKDDSYTIPKEYGFGYCQYLPGCAPVKSGFVDKCKELGSTKYIFCGHDHENNASVTDDGITYTYGLKTGPSPVPWNFAKETGGTLITINGSGENQNVNIENYVINENNR